MTEPVERPEAEETEVERVWRQEIERRLSELKMGSVESIPAKDVFDELDALVERPRS
jgi:hypothetical protein